MNHNFELPVSIHSIVEQLSSNSNINNNDLIEIIKNTNISAQELIQYSKFQHDPLESYGRTEVYKSDNFGIYVMTWNPGDFTAIHNHGHSEWGCVFFMGNATHRTYQYTANELKLIDSNKIKRGSIEATCGKVVHAMGNINEEAFLTLHIYGSNNYKGAIIEDSCIYELEKNRIRISKGPAFINLNDNFSKNDLYEIKTNSETRLDYFKLVYPFYKGICEFKMCSYLENEINRLSKVNTPVI